MARSEETITIGLLGAGNVGSLVARTLVERDLISSRVGAPVRLAGVAVRDPEAPRDWKIPGELLTTDAKALVDQVEPGGGADRR